MSEKYVVCKFWNKGTFSLPSCPKSSFVFIVIKYKSKRPLPSFAVASDLFREIVMYYYNRSKRLEYIVLENYQVKTGRE